MQRGPRKLSTYPRNRLIDQEVARCRVSELDLLAAFGDPTKEARDDDGEPIFYWDLEWPCELVMALQFGQLTQVLTVRLDALEVDHALRHLGFEVKDLVTLESIDPVQHAALAAELDPSWELWRQEASGNKECLASGLLRRDAECRRDELDVVAPAPRYWITSTAAPPRPDPVRDDAAG